MLLDPATHLMKLADFGCAKRLWPDHWSQDYVVTRFYRAPELLLESRRYGTAIDLWSAGAVLGGFLKGNVLWMGEDSVDQFDLIQKTLGSPTKHQFGASIYYNTILLFFQILSKYPISITTPS